MQLHANAALSLNQRRRMVGRVVEQGWSLAKAAEAAEVSDRTCSKWVARYRAEGEAGLRDRSSAPRPIPHRTPADRVEVIGLLRRLRMTGAEIAECLGMALSTVSAVLKRIGLGKLSRLEPLEPPNRYERRTAGELFHIDVKKLGRHQRRRLACHRQPRQPERQPPQRRAAVPPAGNSSTSASTTPPAWPTPRSSATRRPPPPSRSCAARSPSTPPTASRAARDDRQRRRLSLDVHALTCRALGMRHLRTRPYRPRTNGKAERFIKTMIAGWNDGAIYGSSRERTAALDGWLWTYNHRRPHGALSHKPPIARLNELNNLPGFYS